MKKSFVITVVIAVAAFLAGYLVSRGGKGSAPAQRKILYYVDPMHPAYKSDKPGIAPDCGMQLEPVYADGGPAGGSDTPPPGLPPGVVRVPADRQQLIGVRTAVVERTQGGQTIKTVGRVVPEENRLFRVLAATDGFVKRVSPVTTGAYVTREQYLATIYSGELYATINQYVFALNSIDRSSSQFNMETKTYKKVDPKMVERFRGDVNVRNQRSALINIGMSDIQIKEIEDTRYNRNELDVRAIASGYVLSRNIAQGERFERGAEFYRIADLSKVWVLADIYESEAAYFSPGRPVSVQVPQQGLTIAGRVSPVLPVFDPATRTFKVRVEVENPKILLRPGMFVTVEIQAPAVEMVAVPAEAVLDSGVRKTVFVDRGNGWFEPREVETGRSLGDRVEIRRGLAVGEKIVVSGNFLLDSESRLKNAAAGIYGKPGRDPVCGMALDEDRAKAANLSRQFGGRTYYFCGPEDMAKFDKAPQRYTGPNAVIEPMAPHGGAGMKPMVPGAGHGAMPGMSTPGAMPGMPDADAALGKGSAGPMPPARNGESGRKRAGAMPMGTTTGGALQEQMTAPVEPGGMPAPEPPSEKTVEPTPVPEEPVTQKSFTIPKMDPKREEEALKILRGGAGLKHDK